MASTEKTADDAADTVSEMASNTSRAARREIASLRRKIEKLMDEHDLPDMEGMVARAEHVARDTADSVRHQADRLAGQVHDRPFAALGLALALGYAIAVLTRR